MNDNRENPVKALATKIVEALTPKPPNTMAVFAGVFGEFAGRPVISSGDLKAISAADIEWKAAWRIKNIDFTPDAARDEHARRVGLLANGKEAPVDGLETLKAEYATRTAGAEERMRNINQKSLPLVKMALENFAALGDSWIDDRLAREKGESSKFGIHFSPSPVLLAAQKAVATAKIQLKNLTPGQNSPACYLHFLKL